jgi:hypothetical protein
MGDEEGRVGGEVEGDVEERGVGCGDQCLCPVGRGGQRGRERSGGIGDDAEVLRAEEVV